MPLITNGQNATLTGGLGNAITHFSLHTGDPGTTGVNEVTGGSPAYARKAVTWGTVATGQRATATTAQLFDVPTSTTVYHVGFWDALTVGNFYGYYPLGGFAATAALIDQATDIFTCFAHGYTAGQQVLVYDIGAAGLQTGFTEGVVYYVIAANLATDTFQLSTTSGGAASTVTVSFKCGVQRVLPEVFGAQGTLNIAIGNLTLDARFV